MARRDKKQPVGCGDCPVCIEVNEERDETSGYPEVVLVTTDPDDPAHKPTFVPLSKLLYKPHLCAFILRQTRRVVTMDEARDWLMARALVEREAWDEEQV